MITSGFVLLQISPFLALALGCISAAYTLSLWPAAILFSADAIALPLDGQVQQLLSVPGYVKGSDTVRGHRCDTATEAVQMWEQSKPMLHKRGNHAAVQLTGHVYVMGGGQMGTHYNQAEMCAPAAW